MNFNQPLPKAWKKKFIQDWWDSAYDEYISGNDFTERDQTSLFQIFKKYLPERARLREALFQEATLDSIIGRQCLNDMVKLCISTERVAYYPKLSPVDDCCPVCSKPMPDFAMQRRAKHILQCRRQSLGGPPYQQRYGNGKRAHRRIQRDFVQFCYLCADLCCDEKEWKSHCQTHLNKLHPRCGILTLRYTLVAPGFCPFCLGDAGKEPDERFQQWLIKSTLLNHIENHFDALKASTIFICPHPCCQEKDYHDPLGLRRHFFDAHSIEEPRSNCIKRKRKWQEEPVLEPETDISQASYIHADSKAYFASEDNESLQNFGEASMFDMEELMEEFTHYNTYQVHREENEGSA